MDESINAWQWDLLKELFPQIIPGDSYSKVRVL